MVFHNELSQPTSLWTAAGRAYRRVEFERRRGSGGCLSRDSAAHPSAGTISPIQQKLKVYPRKSMGDRHGPGYYARIGSKSGPVTREHSPDWYAAIGGMGRTPAPDSLGIAHYERIGRMGGLRARRREREAQEGNQ